MEFEIIKWGAYALAGILGWFVRVLWTAQEQMRKDFSELEKELPVYYIRREEFKESIKEMKEGLREAVHPVLSKLDKMDTKIEEHRREMEARIGRVGGQ
jgi:cell division protein FtsB